jgi:hypothetical protein
MTKIDIINDTVAFYSADPKRLRSLEDGNCVYNGINGNHCGVGRYFIDEVKSEREYFKYNYDMGVQDLDAKMPIDTILINEVRGHSIAFGQIFNIYMISESFTMMIINV